MTGRGATSEWSLLLAACSLGTLSERTERARAVIKNSIDWSTVFKLADAHGTQPLLSEVLVELKKEVPEAVVRTNQQAQQQSLLKCLLLSRELVRIVSRLAALGIEVMPYKGLALAELLYRDVARRKAGDIDLLIRAADLTRVQEVVRELGYKPHTELRDPELQSYLQSGYEMSFDGEAGPNLLEIQWAIQPNFYAIDFEMGELFSRAVSVTVAGHTMKTLCPEDLLLVLSAHAAKHMWAKLLWLCDIARLTRFELDWTWIGAQVRDKGLVRILRVTFLLNQKLLGASIPTSAEDNVPSDHPSTELAEEIEQRILIGQDCSTESISYFKSMLNLRERRTDRMRFLRRLVFTPGPGEWKAVRLPPSLTGLYPVVRLFRVSARLVGLG